ncbi:MAG: CHAT domain-containing protein [Nitrospinales bacterium]
MWLLMVIVLAPLALSGPLAGDIWAEDGFNRPVQLTTNPGEDFAPAVAGDGSFMVYVSDRSGNLDLWWKRLGPGPGAPDRRLTFHSAADTTPTLSPDGKWVAFISHRSDAKGDLYLLRLDGQATDGEPETVRLTGAGSSESDPAWSADGKFVFFSSLAANGNFKKIYKIGVKGKSKTPVSPMEGFNGAVSPDGRYLAFVSKKDDPSGSLWVQDLQGSGLAQVTRGDDIDVSPAWSVDGKRIYFVRYRDDTNGDGRLTIEDRANIWSLEWVNGAGKLRQLTDSSTYDLFPASARGKLIFTSDRKTNSDIWELPAQGLFPLPGDYAAALKKTEALCPGLQTVSYRCLLAYTNLVENFSGEEGIARAHYRLAQGHLRMGHSNFAEKIFNALLKEAPGDPLYRGLAEIDLLLLQAAKSKKSGKSVYRREIRKILKPLETLTGHEEPGVAARAYLEMGNVSFELEELNRALNFYKKVIAEYPRQRNIAAEAAWSQSKIYTTVGDHDNLVLAFVRVVRDYYDVEVWRQKAIREIFALFEKQPVLEDKVSELRALSVKYEKAPALAAALQNRIGELYYRASENLLAKEAYQQTIKRFPDVVSEKFKAQFALANIYSEEENFEKSLSYYQEIAAAGESEELKASRQKARAGYIRKSIEKGKWELKVGETKLALKSFLKLIAFSPETIEAHRGYVQAGAALGKIDDAIRFYKSRLGKNGGSAADHYALGLAYTYLNPPGLDEAEKEIGQALSVNSQDVYFHQTLGWVFEQKETLQKKEDYLERALQEYQTALALNDEDRNPENEANLLLNLGNGNYLLKNFSTAYHYYKQRAAVQLAFADPRRAAVFYQRFGESAFKAGNSVAAVRQLQKALEIVSANKELKRMAELNDRIALAYQDQRKYAGAVEHFTAAMDLHRKTGNYKSMTRAMRNIANNLFWLSRQEGGEDARAMSHALANYFRAVENLEKFGVIGKDKKSGDGLINVQVETPLGENASTAASGFDEVGEKKMAFHYIGKIYGDFKEYGKAVDYFQKKLDLVADNLDPEKDVAALLEKALIQNQIGNFSYRKGDYDFSLRYFRLSYDASRQLRNRRGIVVNAANMGRVLLAKLQSRPIGPLRDEIQNTVKLLEDAVTRMEKFRNFPNPEYGVYLRNYLGIFYQYLARLSQGGQAAVGGKQTTGRPPVEAFLAAYKELRKESDLYFKGFDKFGKKSARFFEQALSAAGNLAPGPEKDKLEAALRQNLLVANSLARKPGKSKNNKKVSSGNREPLPYRWQFEFLQSLEKDGDERLALLLQAEKQLSRLPYGLLPADASSRAMLTELYQVLTREMFDRRKYREAMYFSEKGLQWSLIALRQAPPLKTRQFQDETRQDYYAELESLAAQIKEAVDGMSEGQPKLDEDGLQALLDEYAEFVSLVREDDRELASLFYPEVPDAQAMQALLRPGDLVLKYQKINDRILIWAIDRSSVRGGKFVCDPGILKLLSRVASGAVKIGPREIADLSNTFVVPVEKLLGRAKFLYLVAGGPLEFLPWAAMSFKQRPLVEALPIAFLSSFSQYYFSQARKNLYNSRLLAVEFPEKAFAGIGPSFAAAQNLAGGEGASDRFRTHWQNYGVLDIESPVVLRSAVPEDSYISMTRNEDHFERLSLRELFRTTLGGNFIALNTLKLEGGGELSPTALLLQGLTFTGYPGVLLGMWNPPNREEFLDLFYRDFRKGNPAESLRRAQVELARRHPGSYGWARYRFYGFPGMTEHEKQIFAQAHFDANVTNGLQAFSEKRWESSINSFEKALSLIGFLPEKKFQQEIYKTLALGAYNLKDYPAAIKYQLELVRLAEQADDPEQLAQAVYFLGILHSRAEQYPRAVELLQKALSIYQEYELLDRLAESYSTLGIVEENALDYGKALQAFNASLKINEEIGEDLNKGRELRRIGRIYYLRLANYDEARKYFAEANKLFQELDQTDQIAETLLELGLVTEKQGDFDRALALYRQAQSLAEVHDLQLGLSKSLLYQGNSYWYQGNYQNAFRMQKRSLEIAEAIGDKRQQTFIHNTLGLIYWTLNDSERALRSLHKSLDLAREINSLLDIATAFNNIGLIYRKDKQYGKAIEFFNKALERDIRLKSKWGQGYTHRNLGISYLRMGRLDQAENHIKQAVGLSRAIGNRTNEVKSMLELGNLALKRKQCAAAIAVFRKTETLAAALGIPEVRWRALRGQGMCLAQTGRPDEAVAAYKKAVDTVEKMRAAIKIEEFQNGFLTDKQDVYKELILLLLDQGKNEESFSFAERAKSRSFIDLLGNNKINLKNEVSQKLYDRLIRQKNKIRKLEEALGRSGDGDKTRQLSAQLVAERDRYRDFLIDAKEQSPQISSFIAVESIGLKQLQGLLEINVALVEYLVTKDELVAWVVKKDGLAVARTQVSEQDLARVVKDYRKRMQQSAPMDDTSARLYAWVIKPIEEHIRGTRILGLIPNGILHYVSFASLKGDGGYLVEQHPLFYSPSASVLQYTFARKFDKSKIVKVLAVGNPDLGSLNYDLPLAELEARSIKWDFPQIDLLTGDKARESWIKEHINDYQIIHIASHGEFDAVNPLFSALKLTRDESDDGNFEVNEVFAVNVNADLVTLSACQTGLGKIVGGDELVGLNRAFIYAGTHAILSSLWRVSDISTAILVKHFYRIYAREEKAESLRKAQLLVKKLYPHPSYWAGFNLTGDYR